MGNKTSTSNTKLVDYIVFYKDGNKTGQVLADIVGIIQTSETFCGFTTKYGVWLKKQNQWLYIRGDTYKYVTIEKRLNPTEKELRDRIISLKKREEEYKKR